MRILALDTTTPTATAGIWTDGIMTGLYTIQTTTHSTTLLPMIESLLKNLSLTITDLDAMAVSVGPGSFTGIRIGVSTIKGLAYSSKIPCIGVSSLFAMAWNLSDFPGILCPVINARRSQVFTAMFQSDGIRPPTRLTEDDLLPAADLYEKLKVYNLPVYGIGDGYALLQKTLPEGFLATTPQQLMYPNAYSVAAAAAWLYESATNTSGFNDCTLSPVYLRKSQAEREREDRLAARGETNN